MYLGTRGKPNEQLFSKQVVIQLPKTVTKSAYTSIKTVGK